VDGPTLDDLRLSVRTAQAAHGPHHPATGLALAAVVRAATDQRRHDEAEMAGRRALAILQTQPVPDRVALAALLEDLGRLYRATDRPTDADHALGRAAALLANGGAAEHSSSARTPL
jgi:hypothetical protein